MALIVVSFVPGVVMLTTAVSLGQTKILLPMAVRAALLVAALIALWHRSRVELPGHLVFASALLHLAWGAYDLRATFPLMALSVLLMAALLLCGARAGWMWLLAVCVTGPATVLTCGDLHAPRAGVRRGALARVPGEAPERERAAEAPVPLAGHGRRES